MHLHRMDTTINKILRRLQKPLLLSYFLLFCTESYAIPSPDLVINLSASIAQLLGLISVLFGGFAFSVKKRANKKKGPGAGKSSGVILACLFILFAASLTANILQYSNTVDAKNSRLHTNLVRKSTENGKTVGDTSLKTLSFSDQLDHPLGVKTDTVEQWLRDGSSVNLYDVREDAEVESGMISGARQIRYPDLLANPDLIPDNGKSNLLLCYSGNRSSELCAELQSQGKACNFMIGGYEKWLSESRPINGEYSIAGNDLRSIADYKNKNTLLDTPDVHELVEEEKAQFIDVRYPAEFNGEHLPGAHNITMRALTSEALERELLQLPDVPLIAACYDKRSCFYSQLIGLSLDRMGRDFRGRYTVPNEYYLPAAERAHVANWRVENQRTTLIDIATVPLNSLLNYLTELSGHYVAGVFLLVLMIRLGLLAPTLKAERDQIVIKSLKPELERIKRDYSEHARALSKATLKLYRDHRIKPIYNLLASFTQLGLLLLFFSVVNSASSQWSQSFLWISNPAETDPLYVTPLLVTSLFMFIVVQQLAVITRKKALMLGLGGCLFFALVQSLNAAANIYLIFSLLVLIGQNLLVQSLSRRFNWDGMAESRRKIPVDDGLIPLKVAHLLPNTGKKAARLGELIEAGYRVPDGFVVTDQITHRIRVADDQSAKSMSLLTDSETRKLKQLWSKLKTERVAVRSSGLSEDSSDTSFAGIYESVLNVSKRGLINAIREVYRSLASDLAETYNNEVNSNRLSELSSGLGGVVVQKMVNAEYAGVMFTEHPANTGAILVEVVSGLGEGLVSGTVTPDSYTYGKITGTSHDTSDCPIDLQPLLKMGRELEHKYAHPQDIEWAYAEGQFYLLQTRDITRSISDKNSATGFSEAERLRLLEMVTHVDSDDPVFEQNELSELLPAPTPMSASFMQRLWSSGGSTDLACQQLGIPYDVNISSDDFVTTVFGRTYINKSEEKLRLGKGPGAVAAFNLARNADEIESHFREEFLPSLLKSTAMNHSRDYSKLSLSEMVKTLDYQIKRFVGETYFEAEIINIAADYYWKTASAKLSMVGEDPAKYLNFVPQTQVSKAMDLISRNEVKKSDIEQFLDCFGHRSTFDYELSMPRYEEDPALLLKLIKGTGPRPDHEKQPPLPEKKLLRISVDRVHRFQALKEDAKHFCMLELFEIRKLLTELDKRCGFEEDIFQLSIEEALRLDSEEGLDVARRMIVRRRYQAEIWKSLSPPARLTIEDLESMDVQTGKVMRQIHKDALAGKRVAGDGAVRGVARVIHSIDEIGDFEEGEILVARMTDPQWYPLFPKARGIITEVGGWLSHAAIVAREYNLPAVVGVTDACARLNTGDVVELHRDGTLTHYSDQRSTDSKLRKKKKPLSGEVQTGHDEKQSPLASVVPMKRRTRKNKTLSNNLKIQNQKLHRSSKRR